MTSIQDVFLVIGTCDDVSRSDATHIDSGMSRLSWRTPSNFEACWAKLLESTAVPCAPSLELALAAIGDCTTALPLAGHRQGGLCVALQSTVWLPHHLEPTRC